jgi:hypothetical protein
MLDTAEYVIFIDAGLHDNVNAIRDAKLDRDALPFLILLISFW